MPVATCVVRLSEVSPDGASALVATGVLNLTHRHSDTDPEPMPRRSGRAARGGAHPAARHRVPVHAGSPDPADGPHELLAGPLAVAVPRRAAGPPRAGGALAARAAGVAGRRAHARGPRVRVTPGRTARGRRRASPTSRSGRPRRIRRPGRCRDDRGRRGDRRRGRLPPVLGGATRCSRHRTRIRPARAWRATSSTAGRSRGTRSTSGPAGASSRMSTAFEVGVSLDVRLDGEPFFARDWRERMPRRLV